MSVVKYGFRVELCRTCSNSEIIWAMTKNDKAIPVDVEPDPLKGNIELVDTGTVIRANVLKPSTGRNDLRTSHFATCPRASEWRRR